MKIELFGYYFYPAFFITVIGVPILIAFIIIFARRFKLKRKVYSNSLISAWQKKYIPKIIDNEISEATNSQYIQILKDGKDFVVNNKYWNNDEMVEKNKDSIVLLTKLFFDKVRREYKEDPDTCVLLLNTIDIMNGGIDADIKSHWMSEDLQYFENDERMTKNEGRLVCLCATAIHKLLEEYVDDDIGRIPQLTLAIDELKGEETEDIASVERHLLHCTDFTDLSNSDYDLITRALFDLIDKEFKQQRDDYFEPYYLCYFRALACSIDKNLYDDIIDSIE